MEIFLSIYLNDQFALGVRLGVRRDLVKSSLVLGAERLGRLKPNGRLWWTSTR